MPDYNEYLAQQLLNPRPVNTFLADENRRRMASALLVKQASSTDAPVYGKGFGYSKLAAGLLGGLMTGNENRLDDEAKTQAMQTLGLGSPDAQTAQPAQTAAAPAAAGDGTSSPSSSYPPSAPNAGYMDTVKAQESGGDPNAQSQTSSAAGPYQFTQGTWDGLSKNNPQLGLTPEGRTDPAQADKAMQAFTTQNMGALKNAGIDATPQNLYMTHFLGSQGGPAFIQGMQQNPNAPATSLVSPDAAKANQSVFFNPDGSPRTAQQAYDLQTKRFQGTQVASADPNSVPGTPQSAAPQAAQPQPTPQGPTQSQLIAIAMNDRLSPAIRQYAMNRATPQENKIVTAGDGTVLGINPRTLVTTPVYSAPKAPVVVNGHLVRVNGDNVKELGDYSDNKYTYKDLPDGSVAAFNANKPEQGKIVSQAPAPANPYSAPGAKPPNENQANAANYANRMAEAHGQINGLTDAATSPVQAALSYLPGHNLVISSDRQKLEQAQRNFVNAVLRRESGAAISAGEFDSANKQYFPSVGDSPEVIAQKSGNRESTIKGVMAGAGPGYRPPDAFQAGAAGWHDMGNGVRIREKQ
jgi:hypothetical protein